MAVNLRLGVNSGNTRRVERPGSLVRRRSSQQRLQEPQFQPKFEWLDSPEAHILRVELPGFKKENLSVHIDLYRNLTVRGERPHPMEETELAEGGRKPRQQFRRVVNVPENVDTSYITASFGDDILHVTVPKMNPTSPITSIQITDHHTQKNVYSPSNLFQTPLAAATNETQLHGKKSQETTSDSEPSELGQKEMIDKPHEQTKIEPSFPAEESLPPPPGEEKEKSEAKMKVVEEKEYVKPSGLGQKSEEKEMAEKPPEQTIIEPSLPAKEILPPPPAEEKEKSEAKTQEVEEKENVKPSGLSQKSEENEMAEKPPEQAKIDPGLPAEESLPPPTEKEKEKSEAEIEEVKEKAYVDPSELRPKSEEKEMAEKAPEQTKIDPSLPAEENLPPPPREEKDKFEAKMQEVEEKHYSSGAVDETHEIKEEKLNSDVKGSEIPEARVETLVPCVSLLKMWRRSLFVVSAILVFYFAFYIARRLVCTDDY